MHLKLGAKLIIRFLAFILLVSCACSRAEESVLTAQEVRLRQRISEAFSHFESKNFEAFIKMRTRRQLPMMFESEKEKEELLRIWRQFVNKEKPNFELVHIKMGKGRAIAKMKGSVLDENRLRIESIHFDLWIFEAGDWFLDDSLKTSPEFLRKD